MGSLSTLNVNGYRRILPSPAKIHQPECFTIMIASGFHTSQNLSPKYKLSHKKTSKRGTEIRGGFTVATVEQEAVNNNIEDEDPLIEYIRSLLETMGDGRESVSAYDTAWVAMIKELQGGDGPQFPASVEWIAENQLRDGSWGDDRLFCIYDRLVNTIACVVALRSWKVHPHSLAKGVAFIKENLDKLKYGNAEHMTCGFELVFPALLQKAKALGIQDLPYHAPVIQQLYHTREQKLEKTPREMMHKVATSLLFSLEGLENLELEWDKLLKLQKPDGSFLTSLSSTAFAFIKTNDHKCLHFITKTIHAFNGGAPNAYPVDIFGRLWAIDRLQRLGISRFFHSQIAACLDYVHEFWTDKGVFSGRESDFCDIDDTSMGLRLLRMHGYHVDPDVLRNFKQGDKFSCYRGQMFESPSPIFNLYRASQLQFPGEEILQQANKFANQFLQQNLATNQLLDKWFRSEHLVDEIRTGLEMPWYATLPRVEARYYIQHYGGSSDVWIGKTLYRLPEICNDKYRELAVKDFKICQDQHQLEWISIQEWHASCNIEELGISRKELLLAYFLATASIFERERTKERVAWAKSQILAKMIASFFNKVKEATSLQPFLSELRRKANDLNNTCSCSSKRDYGFANMALASLTQFLAEFDRHTSHQLKIAWIVWITKLQRGEADGADAELLTNTINICAGHIAFREEILPHNEYTTLSNLTSKICQQLSQIQREKEQMKTAKCSIKKMELEQDMQALVKLVLEKSADVDRNIKNTFLQVAQTYYYRAYYDVETIDTHIFKVLFEPVA